MQGAAAQALQTRSERTSNNASGGHGETSPSPENRSQGEDHFDLVLTARGNIRLETMSWIEAVRRKYGFTDETQGTVPSGRPGRTASAGLRASSVNPALREDSSE